MRSPVWMTDWAWPLERRTIAWIRATNSTLWNGLVHVVVGAQAKTPDLVLDAWKAGEDEDRRLHLRDPQAAQDLEAERVRKIKVEEDDVVVVDRDRSLRRGRSCRC